MEPLNFGYVEIILDACILYVRVTSRERAQPTTFRIQISFLLLVTGHAIGLLVLVDNNYCTSLASPTAGSGPELELETAPNLTSGTLMWHFSDCRAKDRPRDSLSLPLSQSYSPSDRNNH